MLKNFSHKKKFFLLCFAVVATAFLAYQRSFSKTFTAKNELNVSENKLELIKNSKFKIAALETEVQLLDQVIGKHAANPDIVQQEILNKISLLEKNIELVKLAEVHKAANSYFKIYTNQLILTGDYNNLIAACYEFEKYFDYSRIISLSLYTEKDSRTKRKKLFERITFQNYEKAK